MKKAIILASAVTLLSACATVNQKNASLQQDWSGETNAFSESTKAATQECGYKEGQKRERKKAVPMAKCITRVTEKYVIPYAKYPDLVRDMRAQDELRSKEYANGKISYEDFKKRGIEMSADYDAKWTTRANSELSQAAENSNNGQILGQMLLGGMQGYSNGAQNRKDEAVRNKPVRCIVNGYTATCN